MKSTTRRCITLLTPALGLLAGVCAKADTALATFDNFVPNALYASWSTGTTTSGPTNFTVTATGYGSCWKQLGPPPISATGETNIVLDIEISGSTGVDGNIGVIIDLTDADSTKMSYRWYGRSSGHHILTGNLFNTNVPATDNGTVIAGGAYQIVTNAPGTTPGLDLTSIWHLNMEVDPSSYTSAPYTIKWNDLQLTGAASVTLTGVCGVVNAFDGTSLGGLMGSWTAQTSTSTNVQIIASGWGGGYGAVTPNISTDSGKTLQVNVSLMAPSTANGKLGPIVILQDGDGTQMKYAWYGQDPGTNKVLTSLLSSGTLVAAGSTAGFNSGAIAFYQIQLDPSSYSGTYTSAWNDISIIGCPQVSTSTGLCATVSTFDNWYMDGDYGSWQSANEVTTATNWQMTASGFGGAFAALRPILSTTSDKTLQFNLTLSAPASANGLLGPLVVLEDADTTQLRFAWYGQSPGTNLVLTSPLSSGVIAQAGNTPGFDFSNITYFHVQLDPSSYTGSYDFIANDLSIIGCAPVTVQIVSQSYDPATGQFTLTWTSEPGASYALQATSDLSLGFNGDIASGISSLGSTTTVTISLNGPRNFVRVRKE